MGVFMEEETNGKKNDFEKLNPQITTVEYGIRELKELTLYPMSVPDQMRLTDTIQKVLNEVFANKTLNNVEFVKFLVGLIKENLLEILKLSTGLKKSELNSLLEDTTSMQAWNMAETIYRVNLGDILKNVKSLIEEVGALFPSMRQLPAFANDIPATDSSISPDSLSETEV